MTRIYLIRHAEAEGNISKRFHGQYDSDVTENGKRQLVLLKERFKNIDIDSAYSSDLKRAYETAKAVIGDRNIDIKLEPDLREINGGAWEDREWSYIAENYADEFHNFNKAPNKVALPGGESALQLQTRVKNKIFEIVKNNPKRAVSVTSHGMAIKTFLCYAHGIELADMRKIIWCDNTAVTAMDFSDTGDITFVFENDSTHLTDETATIIKQKWWQKENSL